MPTTAEIKHYLEVGIASFRHDPADSKFQRGYLAALEAVYADNFKTRDERAAAFADRKSLTTS